MTVGAGEPVTDMRGATAQRGFWRISFALLVVMSGTTMPTPLFDLYEQDLGLTPVVVTTLFAAYGAGVVSALLVLDRADDQLAPRARLAVGLLFAAVAAAIFIATDLAVPLTAARVLSGLAAGFTAGTATAALIDLGGDRRERSAAIAVMASFCGLAVGAVVAGVSASLAPDALTAPFLIHLVLVVAASPALLVLPRRSVAATVRERMRPVRAFWSSSMLGGCGFAANAVVPAVGAPLLVDRLDIGPLAAVGGLIAIVFLATALGQLGVRWVPPTARAPLGGTGVGLGMVVFATACVEASVQLFVVASVTVGLATGLCTVAGLITVTESASGQTARVVARHYCVLYGSMAIAVTALGVAVQLTALVPATVAFCGVTALAALAAAAWRSADGAVARRPRARDRVRDTNPVAQVRRSTGAPSRGPAARAARWRRRCSRRVPRSRRRSAAGPP